MIKTEGSKHFTKKILGVYLSARQIAEKEIKYHTLLMVDVNPRFLNKACSKAVGFGFDPSGLIRSLETRAKITASQLSRQRTPEEQENRRKFDQDFNQQEWICPHCNQKGKGPTGKRWHFDNCKKNKAGMSEAAKKDRENLAATMAALNKSRTGKPHKLKQVQCPHCRLVGNPGHMKQGHLNNCTQNPLFDPEKRKQQLVTFNKKLRQIKKITCEFCKKLFQPGNLKQHQPKCPVNPNRVTGSSS